MIRTLSASLFAAGCLSLSACGQEAAPRAPAAAAPQASAAQPDFTAAEADASNWRAVGPDNLFVFETTKGTVVIEAFPDLAPGHVKQFREMIRSGLYDGTPFHRVIRGFMAQGGDIAAVHGSNDFPAMEGEFTIERAPAEMTIDAGGEADAATQGYYRGMPVGTQAAFLAELNATGTVETWGLHCPGVVSTARTSDPNSARSQFFLMRGTSPHLDKEYTAWGRILSGFDAVNALKTGEPVRNPDILTRARVAADLPESERPRALVQRTDGPDFAERLVQQGAAPVCDQPPVPALIAAAGADAG